MRAQDISPGDVLAYERNGAFQKVVALGFETITEERWTKDNHPKAARVKVTKVRFEEPFLSKWGLNEPREVGSEDHVKPRFLEPWTVEHAERITAAENMGPAKDNLSTVLADARVEVRSISTVLGSGALVITITPDNADRLADLVHHGFGTLLEDDEDLPEEST